MCCVLVWRRHRAVRCGRRRTRQGGAHGVHSRPLPMAALASSAATSSCGTVMRTVAASEPLRAIAATSTSARSSCTLVGRLSGGRAPPEAAASSATFTSVSGTLCRALPTEDCGRMPRSVHEVMRAGSRCVLLAAAKRGCGLDHGLAGCIRCGLRLLASCSTLPVITLRTGSAHWWGLRRRPAEAEPFRLRSDAQGATSWPCRSLVVSCCALPKAGDPCRPMGRELARSPALRPATL